METWVLVTSLLSSPIENLGRLLYFLLPHLFSPTSHFLKGSDYIYKDTPQTLGINKKVDTSLLGCERVGILDTVELHSPVL